MRNTSVLLCSTLAFLLASCNTASIVALIGEALAIAEQAAAISGVVPSQYVAYVGAASECIAFAAEEEGSSDEPAVKAAKIGLQCAELVTANLPADTPPEARAIATELAQAIQKILAELPAAGKLGPQHAKPLSDADREMLKAISLRAHRSAEKVRARR